MGMDGLYGVESADGIGQFLRLCPRHPRVVQLDGDGADFRVGAGLGQPLEPVAQGHVARVGAEQRKVRRAVQHGAAEANVSDRDGLWPCGRGPGIRLLLSGCGEGRRRN